MEKVNKPLVESNPAIDTLMGQWGYHRVAGQSKEGNAYWLQYIPLSKIDLKLSKDLQVRIANLSEVDPQAVAKLIRSYRDGIPVPPCLVISADCLGVYNTDTYAAGCGNHRIDSARQAGYDGMDMYVLNPTDMKKFTNYCIRENVNGGTPMSPQDLLQRALAAYMAGDMTLDESAEHFSVSVNKLRDTHWESKFNDDYGLIVAKLKLTQKRNLDKFLKHAGLTHHKERKRFMGALTHYADQPTFLERCAEKVIGQDAELNGFKVNPEVWLKTTHGGAKLEKKTGTPPEPASKLESLLAGLDRHCKEHLPILRRSDPGRIMRWASILLGLTKDLVEGDDELTMEWADMLLGQGHRIRNEERRAG